MARVDDKWLEIKENTRERWELVKDFIDEDDTF
jgi:hypothetical protein